MKILVLDNYDSFTYNLVHLVEKIVKEDVDVFFNDKIQLEQIAAYDKIILSPGPGIPSEAGILLPLIKKWAPIKSILGVCLGHQAIGEAFGASIKNLDSVYHGVAHEIKVVHQSNLFKTIPTPFEVGRYHSWIINEDDLPKELIVTARDENNFIMAVQHQQYDVQGVQFHPESIMTPCGEIIMRNWLGS